MPDLHIPQTYAKVDPKYPKNWNKLENEVSHFKPKNLVQARRQYSGAQSKMAHSVLG